MLFKGNNTDAWCVWERLREILYGRVHLVRIMGTIKYHGPLRVLEALETPRQANRPHTPAQSRWRQRRFGKSCGHHSEYGVASLKIGPIDGYFHRHSAVIVHEFQLSPFRAISNLLIQNQ